MSQKTTVLLADDHAMVRAGIRQFLEHTDELEVVAERSNGGEVIAYLEGKTARPDVVVLDIKMPHLNGIETTQRIKSMFPKLRVMILTAFDDAPYISAILEAGADGYMLKTATPQELVNAVKAVSTGQMVLAPTITQQMVKMTTQQSNRPEAEHLTKREREVLERLKTGMTNKEIALDLGIGDRTVQTHLSNIYFKLEVNNRTEALIKANNLGLITFPSP